MNSFIRRRPVRAGCAAFTSVWRSPAIKPGLLAVIALLISLEAWGVHLFDGQLRAESVGTVGDWVSGAGTVAAVVVALREAAIARDRSRLDSLCAVSAWMELVKTQGGQHVWNVTLLNATAFPIYRWAATPSVEDADWHLCYPLHGALVPGASQFEIADFAEADHAHAVPIEIVFEDRDGSFWRREPGGRLALAAIAEVEIHSAHRLTRQEPTADAAA